LCRAFAQTPRDFAIDLSAAVSTNAPRVTLHWTLRRPGNIAAQAIHRRLKGEHAWVKQADLATNSITYADDSASTGVEYEYWMERTYSGIYPSTAMGYLSAGVNVPMVESRGTLLLVIDDTMVAPLAPEIGQLQADLTGDGWLVQTLTAVRTNAPASVKAQIVAAYNADPENVKAVYLLGHVPVPYSGDMAPDLHVPDHLGAWPADGYYGDVNGTWTDSAVDDTAASRSQNDNVPGDGKFDPSYFPSPVELMVGRVDLHGMTRAPCASVSETALLRRYLRKAHDFRMRQGAYASVPRQSLIRDGFGHISGESFAIAGWSWAFTGAGSLVDEAPAGQWFSPAYAGGKTYLIAYGNGGGSYESAAGVGDTADFGLKTSRAVFTSLFGSYFGDWDSDNNLLRAPLAGNATGDSLGLTCFWGGRPNRFMHHLGMGETAGYGMRASQNGSLAGGGNYVPNNDARTHSALMGDPALRLYMAEPPRNLSAITSNSCVALSWGASTEPNLIGYHVYRAAAAAGPFTRLTASPQAGASYVDATVSAGQSYTYLVRTLTCESVPGGTFDNLSVGVPVTLTANGAAASAPRNPGSLTVTPLASTNAALAWVDTANNESGFRIERQTRADGAYVPLGTVSANVTNFVDEGVFTNGTVYYYRVFATGTAGDSLPSDAASFEAAAGFLDLPVTRLKVSKTAGSAMLAVNRIGGATGAISVSYATTNVSAWAGTHYTATNGVLTWADGETAAKIIQIPLINTAHPQGARQFTVTLSTPTGGANLTLNSFAAVLIEDPTATLGAPWSQTVVGSLTDSSAAVSVSNAICSTTLGGGGLAAPSTSESGQFVFQNRAGDGTLTACFPEGLPSDSTARYALMIRASAASNAAMAAAVATSSAGYGTKLLSRGTAGGETVAAPAAANSLVVPRWLRLTRVGSVFSAETSPDGNVWSLTGSVLLPSIPSTAVWGVFHCSADWSATTLGSFHFAQALDVALSDMPAPSAPTGLTATATAPTRVALTWCTVANAAGYRIERMGETGTYTPIVEVAAATGTTQSWTDAAATLDSGYFYRMTAYNATGTSAYSIAATVTTPPEEIVELVSTDGANGADASIRIDLPSTPLGGTVNLTVAGYDPDSWDILTNAAKTYLRFDLTGRSFARARLRLAFLQEERFDEAGFINHYLFALADSSDGWDESAITWNNAPQNDTTGAGFTGATTYLGYTNLYAVPAAGQQLSFELPAAALAAARGSDGRVTLGLAQLTAGALAQWASREHPTFDAPTLELSSPSPAPCRPTFFTATVESGWSVTLRWTDSSSDETGFELERAPTNGPFSTVQTLLSNTVSFIDTTTAPDSAYDYRLRAFNANGTSSWATVLSVVTPDSFHAVGTLWDGGGENTWLTTAANWDSDLTPAFNGLSYFNFASGGAVATINTNASFLGLSLHRDADFSLASGGGTLTLGTGGIRAVVPTAVSRTYDVAAHLSLATDQRWGVTNNGAGVTGLTISGSISDGASTFGIVKSGDGTLTLAGSNSYDGVTVVTAGGAVRVTHAHALGSTNGVTTVASNAWVEVGGGVGVTEPLTVGDAGVAGALRSTDGTNVWYGRVIQTAPTRIRALAGSRLTLGGGVAGTYDLILAPDTNAEVGVVGGVAVGTSRKLVATGAGVVSVSGTGHTFGTLEVAGLTVRADAPNTLPASSILSIGPSYATSGTFDLNGNDQTVSQLKRGIVSAGARVVTSATPATLTVSGSTSTIYDGQLTGALSLAKAGSSTLTLSGSGNTLSGLVSVSAGTLTVSAAASLGNAPSVRVSGGLLRLSNANALLDSASLSIASPGKVRLDSGTEAIGALYLDGVRQAPGTWGSTASSADNQDNTHFDISGTGVFSIPYVPPGTVWDGGGANTQISNPDNWDTDWIPAFDGTALVSFGSGGDLATVNTDVAFLGLSLNRDADFTLADGGATLTLGGGGLCALAPSETSRLYTLAARIALASNQTWGVTNAGAARTTVLVTGSVSDGPSAFGLGLTGDGTLVLAGSNSYDGVTSVASGSVLRVTHAHGLGSSSGSTTLSPGGRLELGGGAVVPEPLTLNGADQSGSLCATDGTNAWGGLITQTAASRIDAQTGSRLTLSGGVAGSYDLTLAPESDAEIVVTGGVAIGGSRKLVATGAGVVAVSGTGHTFGTLEVAGLTVRADSPNTLSANAILSIGPLYAASGTFDLNGNDQTVSQLKRGAVSAGARVVTSATPATLTVSGSTGTIYDGQLTGALSLAKAGSSTLTLSGSGNTFAGATVIAGGKLDLYATASLGDSQLVAVEAGVLRLRGTSSIADTATLRISNDALLWLDSGVETVGALYLGGVRQRRGTYGSTSSTADHPDNTHFSTSGTGVINVLHGTESVFMVR
jgi:autotransporter-associated beta strand protein